MPTQKAKLTWSDTARVREALFHSRLDHAGMPPHTGALDRIAAAERELWALLGYSGEFSYSGVANTTATHEEEK